MYRDEPADVRRPALRIRRGQPIPDSIAERMGYARYRGAGEREEGGAGEREEPVPLIHRVPNPYNFDMGEFDPQRDAYLKHMKNVWWRIFAHLRMTDPRLPLDQRALDRIRDNEIEDLDSIIPELRPDWSERAEEGAASSLSGEAGGRAKARIAVAYRALVRGAAATANFSTMVDAIARFQGRKDTTPANLHLLAAIFDWSLENEMAMAGRGDRSYDDSATEQNVRALYASPHRPQMALAWALHAHDNLFSWVLGFPESEFQEHTFQPPLSEVPRRIWPPGVQTSAPEGRTDRVEGVLHSLVGSLLSHGRTAPHLVEGELVVDTDVVSRMRALISALDPYSPKDRKRLPPPPADLVESWGGDSDLLLRLWGAPETLQKLNATHAMYRVLLAFYPDGSPREILETVTHDAMYVWVVNEGVMELVELFDEEMGKIARRRRGPPPESRLFAAHLAPTAPLMALAWAITLYDAILLMVPINRNTNGLSTAPLKAARKWIPMAVNDKTATKPLVYAMGMHGRVIRDPQSIPPLVNPASFKRRGPSLEDEAAMLRWRVQWLEVLRLVFMMRGHPFTVHPDLLSRRLEGHLRNMSDSLRILDTRLAPLESGFFYHIIHGHWILEAERAMHQGDPAWDGEDPIYDTNPLLHPSDPRNPTTAKIYLNDYRAGLTSPEAIRRFHAWRVASAYVRYTRSGVHLSSREVYRLGERETIVEQGNTLSAEDLAVAAYFAMWLASPREAMFDARCGGSGLAADPQVGNLRAGVFSHRENRQVLADFLEHVQNPLTAWLNAIKRGDTVADRAPTSHSLRPTATLGLAIPLSRASFAQVMGHAAGITRLMAFDESNYGLYYAAKNFVYVYDVRRYDRRGILKKAVRVAEEEQIMEKWQNYAQLFGKIEWVAKFPTDHVKYLQAGGIPSVPGPSQMLSTALDEHTAFTTVLLYYLNDMTNAASIHAGVVSAFATTAWDQSQVRSALLVIREALLRTCSDAGFPCDKLFQAHVAAWGIVLLRLVLTLSAADTPPRGVQVTVPVMNYIVKKMFRAVPFYPQVPMKYQRLYMERAWVRTMYHELMIRSLQAGGSSASGGLSTWYRALGTLRNELPNRNANPRGALEVMEMREGDLPNPWLSHDPVLATVHFMLRRLAPLLRSVAPGNWKTQHPYVDPPTRVDRRLHEAMGRVAELITAGDLRAPLEHGFVELVVYPLWVNTRETRRGLAPADRVENAQRNFRTQCWVVASTLVRIASGRATRMPDGIIQPPGLGDLGHQDVQPVPPPAARLDARELACAALVALGLYEMLEDGPFEDKLPGEGFYSVFTKKLLRYYDHVFRWPLVREIRRRRAEGAGQGAAESLPRLAGLSLD